MKTLIFSCFIAGMVLTTSPISAEAPLKPENPSINDLIAMYASKYDVSEKVMHRVISCESTYKPTAVGDGGKSFGLVQIHLPSNPKVTKTQALDSEYAIEFLAKGLSKGQGKKWTCWRKYYS